MKHITAITIFMIKLSLQKLNNYINYLSCSTNITTPRAVNALAAKICTSMGATLGQH